MISNLRVATRSSPLAIWQAEEVMRRLQLVQKDLKFELIKIKTEGDKLLDRPLFDIGGKGLFIKELEQALPYKMFIYFDGKVFKLEQN